MKMTEENVLRCFQINVNLPRIKKMGK